MVDYSRYYVDPFSGMKEGMNALQRQQQIDENARQNQTRNALAERQLGLQEQAGQRAEQRESRIEERLNRADQRQSKIDAQTERENQLKLFMTQIDFIGRGLDSVRDPQSHENFKMLMGQMDRTGMFANLKEKGLDLMSMIPQEFDPQRVQQGRELINSLRKKAASGGFTLGEGQVRYDDSGNEIARGPEKAGKQIERTVDLGDKVEYVYADGTREYKNKSASPNTVVVGDRRRATDEMAIRKEFQALPEVKSHIEINSQMERLNRAMAENQKGGSKIAVDQALITILNKMLDPSSVVRESEYARTPSDMAILSRLQGRIEKLKSGGAGLTDEDRDAISRMAKNFYDVSETVYNQQVDYYTDLADRYGYAPENIVRLGGAKGKPYKKEANTAGKYLQKFE